MADNPIEFQQKKQFQVNDDLMKAVLTNVSTFSGDVAELIDNLVNFFNSTKIFLQALSDPLALVLIPSLNALIAALEDLKNVGFGTLSVWPWEIGKMESGVDTSKLEKALTALIAGLSDVDAKNVYYDTKTDTWKVISNKDEDDEETTFDFGAFSNVTGFANQNIFTTKKTDDDLNVPEEYKYVKETFSQVMNFLNPSQWDNGDSETGQFIKKLNESFKMRTLTPSQFISEVNSSFDDINDTQRPVGTGDYLAFITFFALPTHHALRDVTQALMNFFAGVVDDFPDLPDDKITEIELGEPLVFKNIEQNYKEHKGEKIKELEDQIRDLRNTNIQLEDNESATSDRIKYVLANRQAELDKARTKLRELETKGPKLENKIYGFTNTTPRKLRKEIGQNDTAVFEANEKNDFIASQTFSIGSGTETVKIPMFKPGDLIQQGTVFNNFTAEVVKHEPIQIKNGKVIKNTVKVKSVRGKLLLNSSADSSSSNSPPVVKLGSIADKNSDGSLGTYGILKVGKGFDDYEKMLSLPIFSASHSDTPDYLPTGSFLATITSNSAVLTNVLPNIKGIQDILRNENVDIYNRRFDSVGDDKLIKDLIKFVSDLSIGQPIGHDFLVMQSTTAPKVDDDFGFNRILWGSLPGLGMKPVIKKITINQNELSKTDIESQLFLTTRTTSERKRIVGMRPIEIEIGRAVSLGEVEDFPESFVKVPNGSQTTRQMYLSGKPIEMFNKKFSKGLPNWKFTRIQDIFPVYGQTIDLMISQIEFAKDLAEGNLKALNDAIQYFEDIVERLQKLNTAIQNTLLFFTQGLDKMGLYSAKISGNGGIKEFKSKLSSAKIKNVSTNPIPEFDLLPITSTQEIKDPITGDVRTEETTVMKLTMTTPTQEEFDELAGEDGTIEKLISFSELDSLKYSGGFVLFAMGQDRTLLDKFLKLSGLKERDEIENPVSDLNTPEDISTLLDEVKPFVEKIQVQQSGSSDFIDSEASSNVDKNTAIKIIFDNNSNNLTDDQKLKIKNVRGDDFIFQPNIQNGSVFPNTSADPESGGNVILSTDDFETSIPLNFSVEPIQINATSDIVNSVIVRPREKLSALTNLKISVKPSIVRTDGLTLKEEFTSNLGFTTSSTIVSNINFE